MAILFASVIAEQVPVNVQTDVRTTIFLTMMMIIPMATMFIGYAGTYSQEIEIALGRSDAGSKRYSFTMLTQFHHLTTQQLMHLTHFL